jgi:hypothetical protein
MQGKDARTAAAPSAANAWRWKSARAPAARYMGPPPELTAAKRHQLKRERLRYQRDQKIRKGYVGKDPDLGQIVEAYLLHKEHYSLARSKIGGQLCAIGGAHNFQGNRRIAEVQRLSLRTAQRTRKDLETAGALQTLLLTPGDQLPEQRAPVRGYQIVRRVATLRTRALLWWARAGKGYRYQPPDAPAPESAAQAPAPPVPRRTVQAAEVRPDPPPAKRVPSLVERPEPMTAEQYRDLAERSATDPVLRQIFEELAKLNARGPPGNRD